MIWVSRSIFPQGRQNFLCEQVERSRAGFTRNTRHRETANEIIEVQLFPKARDFLNALFGSPKMIRSSASRSMVSFPAGRLTTGWGQRKYILSKAWIKGPPAAVIASCVLLATNT